MSLTAEEHEKLADMLAAIEPEMKQLSDWEKGFIKDQLERHEKYGAGIRLSVKQWAAIRRVHEKVTGEPAEQAPPDEDEAEREYD